MQDIGTLMCNELPPAQLKVGGFVQSLAESPGIRNGLLLCTRKSYRVVSDEMDAREGSWGSMSGEGW